VITNWRPIATFYSVAGGGLMAGSGSVSGNTVILNDGPSTNIAGKVIGGINAATGTVGGWSASDDTNYNSANVHHNKVIITGGVIGGTVSGDRTEGSGNAGGTTAGEENKVFIHSGDALTVSGSIYGGYTASGDVIGERSGTGSATNNTVNVDGTASLNNVSGGMKASGTGDIFSNNTLNKNSAASAIATAKNFENVNFGYGGEANIGILGTGSDNTKFVNLNTATHDVIFGGTISGAGNIGKFGAGTLSLRGNMSGLAGMISMLSLAARY
jgi:hypothetical protein